MNVGLVAFNSTPRVLQSPTRDREVVKAAIDSMQPSGGTATGEAIATATPALRTGEHPAGAAARRDPAALGRQVHQRPRPGGGRARAASG